LRVALVDADLRRKSLSKAFNMENAVGVADLVEKKLLPGSSEDLLKTTVHENLFFLPAGVGAASAITSAPSQSVDAFMEYLLGSVDVVVISAPPCDQYADASRLASLVDQVFLMIAAQRTSLPAVPRARDLLLNAGAKDVKVMMSGADRGDDGMTIQPRHAPAA
jgi:Mrp family chromosome partitioning ATPase